MNTGWILFAFWEIYWLVWAFFALVTITKNERLKKFFIQLSVVVFGVPVFGICVYFEKLTSLGYLWPSGTPLVYAGFIIFVIGFICAIWSRITLGKNWSGSVEIYRDQKLITNGLYKIVRNPQYLGMILMMLGNFFVLGDFLGLLLFVSSIFVLDGKSKDEEQMLLTKFGTEYQEYKKNVKKRLFPFVY